MNFANALIRAEYRQGTWSILDPQSSTAISVDQLLMDVESWGDGYVIGAVVAVHGLPQDIADALTPRDLRALGISFPIRIGRSPKGVRRMRCEAGNSRPVRA